MQIRRYRWADAEPCYAVFLAAVREGATRYYTADQRLAWAPNDTAPAEWADRLGDHVAYVAEQSDQIAGFISMTRDGHLDFVYVAPACMGQGLAGQLHDALMTDPELMHLCQFHVEASHFSRKFLLRRGWSDAPPETVERFGRHLTVFRMWYNRPAAPPPS